MKWASLLIIILSLSACDSSQTQSTSTVEQSATAESSNPIVSPSPTASPTPSPSPTASCIPISQPITFNGTYENIQAMPPAQPSIMAGIQPWAQYRSFGSLSIGAPQSMPGVSYVSNDMTYLWNSDGDISVTVSQTSSQTWIYGTITLSSVEQADIDTRLHGNTCVTGVALAGVLESPTVTPDYRGTAYLFFGDQTNYIAVNFIGQP